MATKYWTRILATVTVEGMMVPGEGEVAWVLPDGPLAHARVGVVDIHFEPNC